MLLSDGKTTAGRDPVEVAREAARRGVPIYTVALGTPEGVDRRRPAALLPVPPDPETMREIARVSGGRAFTPRTSGGSTRSTSSSAPIGTPPEQREITAGFAAGGLVLLLGAAGLAVRGTGRLP